MRKTLAIASANRVLGLISRVNQLIHHYIFIYEPKYVLLNN